MPHTFDTGLTIAHRTALRDACVAALQPLLRVNGGYLEAVERFGGVVRSYTDEVGLGQAFDALAGRSPAILIALGDKSYDEAGGMGSSEKWMASIEVLVYCASNNARGLLEGRHEIDAAGNLSALADPGLDIVMEHAAQLLVGMAPALPVIKRLRPTTEVELATDNGITMWLQTYRAPIAISVNPNRNAAVLLDEIFTTLRTFLAGHGDPGDTAILNVETKDLAPP